MVKSRSPERRRVYLHSFIPAQNTKHNKHTEREQKKKNGRGNWWVSGGGGRRSRKTKSLVS